MRNLASLAAPAAFVACIWYFALPAALPAFTARDFADGMPRCESATARTKVQEILSGEMPLVRLWALVLGGGRVVGIRDQRAVAETPERHECRATAMLSNGNSIPIGYSFTPGKGEDSGKKYVYDIWLDSAAEGKAKADPESLQLTVKRAKHNVSEGEDHIIVDLTVTRRSGAPDFSADMAPYHFKLIAPDGAVYGYAWSKIIGCVGRLDGDGKPTGPHFCPCDSDIKLPTNGSRSCSLIFKVQEGVRSGTVVYEHALGPKASAKFSAVGED